MQRGEIWWASLPEPSGSEPGYSRPVLVIQDNRFNASRINTVIVAVVTSNIRLADAPGCVLSFPVLGRRGFFRPLFQKNGVYTIQGRNLATLGDECYIAINHGNRLYII